MGAQNPAMSKAFPAYAAVAVTFFALPAAVLAAPLVVRTEDCRELVNHVPADDVAYTPRVDVNGNAVVPADLGGGYGMITAPDEITLDIRVDLAGRLSLGGDGGIGDAASAAIGGEGVVGQVTVAGADLYWNGELLPRDTAGVLASACEKAFTAAGIPLPTRKPAASTD
jgi:hypothetical protein